MAKLLTSEAWPYRSAWEDVAVPGLIGTKTGEPIQVTPLTAFGAAILIASDATSEDFSRTMQASYGLEPPGPRRQTSNGGLEMIWVGPGKWFAHSGNARIANDLSKTFDGLAAVFDQSGARGVLQVSGVNARGLFAKGLPVDLHPAQFKPGDVAVSSIAHIGVQFWQTGAQPAYKVAVARSMAGSFWSWLVHAGSEFGLAINPSTPAFGTQAAC